MIATIEGQLASKAADHILVTVGGVGIEVSAPFSTIEKLNSDRVFLYTRLVVREDSLTLYGFATTGERELFDAFLKISGIGPRLAVAILSTMSVENIHNAVRNDRPELISRVPGIGKKTAQKIVLELQDKIPSALEAAPIGADGDASAEVMDALTALGYSVVEAQMAIQSMPLDAPDSVEERVMIALQSLAG
ncbi:MAG: Holliday junction branch migration protein RuvA [Chloroflexota bacterium]|nr:Holliday junction branch migration protein RuvA [Chloroflexota bacterium]MDE2909436.1 Holliday junction branch migration protein RuvA [Chloroflexota bacterium]